MIDTCMYRQRMNERKDGGKIKVTRVLVERLISVRKKYDIHSPLFFPPFVREIPVQRGKRGKKEKGQRKRGNGCLGQAFNPTMKTKKEISMSNVYMRLPVLLLLRLLLHYMMNAQTNNGNTWITSKASARMRTFRKENGPVKFGSVPQNKWNEIQLRGTIYCLL